MADRAQVTSVEAVESFRADLIVFLTKARSVLEEACDEVLRTRQWVQNDQRQLWEREAKVRARKLEEARSELFSARLSQFQDSVTLQQMAVHRADRTAQESEAKLAVLKKWDRDLENRTDPLVKMLNQLHGFLLTDMTQAVAYLGQVVKTLEAYAAVAAPGGASALTATENKADISPSAGDFPAGAGEPDGGRKKP
jgi:hypothetical protein